MDTANVIELSGGANTASVWPTTTDCVTTTNVTYPYMYWPYTYSYRDYTAERVKEVKGWIDGFLSAKQGKLTKADVKRVLEKLEEI